MGGWASARLFAKAAHDAGPKLTRAGLLAALEKLDGWDGYGLVANAGPASKRPLLPHQPVPQREVDPLERAPVWILLRQLDLPLPPVERPTSTSDRAALTVRQHH